MMEFLVNIKIEWPHDMDPGVKEEISAHERAVAAEFAKRGNLVRMWRIPGRRENWGLWQAKDATELHDIISSLPVWPWMDVTVHALARHAVDPNPVMPERVLEKPKVKVPA
jgi:muconolactone D-isomerase